MKNEPARFFHPRRIGPALRAYANRPKARGWWVSEKVRLYAAAAVAFDHGHPDEERFRDIYDTLRAYWQLFRNGKGWSAGRTFAILNSAPCRACGMDRLDLPALTTGEALRSVWDCLAVMSGVKALPRGNVSAMAVSKFLHFFNPRLFPIYDRAVVMNQAFPRFRASINASRDRWRAHLAPYESDRLYKRGLGTYLHYLLWAADCVQAANTDATMRVFARRFRQMAHAETQEVHCPADIDTYYATAFEFAMVGEISRSS
jgi:hypothetical protein